MVLALARSTAWEVDIVLPVMKKLPACSCYTTDNDEFTCNNNWRQVPTSSRKAIMAVKLSVCVCVAGVRVLEARDSRSGVRGSV